MPIGTPDLRGPMRLREIPHDENYIFGKEN